MTEEYKKQIVDLYIKLGTYAKVKAVLGCSWDSICQATKEAGINKGVGGNHPNMIPDNKFIELAKTGKTVKEIAQVLGVYNSTVSQRLRKLGIEPIFQNKDLKFQEDARKVEDRSCGRFALLNISKVKHGKMAEIQCKECGEIFVRSLWNISKTTRCPKCYRPKDKRYLRRLERVDNNKIEYAKKKRCVICGNEFHNSDERRKTCSQECAHILKEANHGLKRFRHKGGQIRDYGITLKRVYDRDLGICWICGKKTNFDDVRYTKDGHKYCGDTHPVKDHLIPLAYGGDESWENIRLACWRCNKNKSDAIVDIKKTEQGKRLVVSERCGKKDGSISIAQYALDGKIIKIYSSIRQASRETGIPVCQISAARVGRQQTAHGFIWKTYIVVHEDKKLME